MRTNIEIDKELIQEALRVREMLSPSVSYLRSLISIEEVLVGDLIL